MDGRRVKRRQVMRVLGLTGILLGAGAAATAEPLSDPTPPTSTGPADLIAWLGANIQSPGWRIADISHTDALFVQPAAPADPRTGTIRVSARWEGFFLPSPQHPWRSALQVLEIDCVAHRFREVSWVAYAGSNFTNRLVAKDEGEAGAWRNVGPGSIVGSALDLSCPAKAPAAVAE